MSRLQAFSRWSLRNFNNVYHPISSGNGRNVSYLSAASRFSVVESQKMLSPCTISIQNSFSINNKTTMRGFATKSKYHDMEIFHNRYFVPPPPLKINAGPVQQ